MKKILKALAAALLITAPAYAATTIPYVSGPQDISNTNATLNTVINYINAALANGGLGTGFPFTLGSTSITANSTSTGVTGLSIVAGGANSLAATTLAISGTTTLSGVIAGTQVSCLGLDSSNHIVLNAAACGTGGSTSLIVGTTVITSGTNGRLLYDNSGTLGELATTGSGNVVLATSPTLVTPALGTPASGTLTNTTGFPAANLAGLGTGVATALATNVSGTGAICLASGSACSGGGSSITIGTTVITSGTTGRVLYDNGGVAGEYAITGTGNAVLSASPTFTGTVTGSAATLSGAVILSGLSSGTQVSCLGLDSGNHIVLALSACGAGGGAVSSVSNSDGTLTVSPTTGAVVASLALGHANVWSAQQSNSITTLTISTATFTPDGTNNNYKVTLVHASCPCTLANPSATPVAGTSGVIEVVQSATGSDTISTWGSDYIYPSGTTNISFSTGANAVDVLSYYVIDSTHILLTTAALNASH